jgi:hypothetical protein
MRRQYKLFYKRAGAQDWAVLEPLVHANLYDREEVNTAINVMRDNRSIEGIMVRVSDAMFNIISFEQEAIAHKAFLFE